MVRFKKSTLLIVNLLVVLAMSSVAVGDTIFVKVGGSGGGTSWGDAYGDLQDALDVAVSDDEIWVAAGTYYPTKMRGGSTYRHKTFQMINGVGIYGGFAGTETVLADRDVQNNETILSGDIPSTNCYHVFYHPWNMDINLDSTAVLDGFTITAGSSGAYSGGGMYNQENSPTVTGCTFRGNLATLGGGMYNYNCSPTVTGCTFIDNSASESGGGMWNYNNNSTVSNCTFTNNSAVEEDGGGMYNSQSSPTVTGCTFIGNSAWRGGGMSNYNNSSPAVTDCTFSGNQATTKGGGMYNGSSSPTVTDCTFSGNSANDYSGSGMCNHSSNPVTVTGCTFSGNSGPYSGMKNETYSRVTVTNCIFWGNTAPTIDVRNNSTLNISYCDLEGGYDGISIYAASSVTWGTGNIDEDPVFIDADGADGIYGTEDDNLRLQAGSPCIDAGDNTAVPAGVTTDLDGNPRFVDDPFTTDTGNGTAPIVDMGAYEYQPPPPSIIYVDADATGGNIGWSWENAYNYLQDALAYANSYPEVNEIWVAGGIYKPDASTANPSGTGDRTATFKLKNGVAIYGGFAGTESSLDARDWQTNETILSGEIGMRGNIDNSYHVVASKGTDATTILDGFTITAGNANGSGTNMAGGGMYNYTGSSPTVTGCSFTGNSASLEGGAMCNDGGGSPTVTNCTFSGNSAVAGGGGMGNLEYSSPTLSNCTFSGNSTSGHGGGMYNRDNSSPTVTNCTFSGNSASYYGGGIFNHIYSSPTVTNCILWGNTGSQIYNYGTASATVNYSDVQGGYGGTGNIDENPLFVDADDNLRLLADSNCIDTGNNSAVPAGVTTDLDGHPRIVDGDGNLTRIVDMGAYEFNWAYIGDFDGEYDVDFADFAIFALAWLTEDGDARWNPDCDISIPADNYIDWRDLDVFSDNWLARARFSPIPHLLFSEYVEGSGYNQAVEIYNAGDVVVYLGGCQVRIYNNGWPAPTNIVPLNAVTLLPGKVFVLGHPGISVPWLCDQLNAGLAFNGNDAIELVYKYLGFPLPYDVIGQIGFNPGYLGWGSGGTTTTGHTLRRKCSVSTGDWNGYDSFYPAVEWESFPVNTFGGLGRHCQ